MMSPFRVRLRSVLFHHVADHESSFTDGLGVRMAVEVFRARVAWLARRYDPVSLDDVRHALAGGELPPRALLVTIDDAYATVASHAAPILDDYGIPSVFFVNGGFIDHGDLNIDNLVMHTANVAGPAAVERAVAHVRSTVVSADPASVLADLVPTLGLAEVTELRRALEAEHDHDPLAEAASAGLYLSSAQLRSLPDSMTIGSHTKSHVRCRMLEPDELRAQITGNRRLLAEMTGASIDGFSVPYGSHLDYPPRVEEAVASAGHDVTFLVEGQLNHGALDGGPIMRVSLAERSPAAATVELEVLPRLRRVRDVARGTSRR